MLRKLHTSLNKRSFFVKLLQLATTLNGIRHFIVYWATFSPCWSALFPFSSFFFAGTSKEHINHVPREVTVNKAPTVADKIKLEHWFPWVLLRCPSGRAPGLRSLSIVQTHKPPLPTTSSLRPIKATLDPKLKLQHGAIEQHILFTEASPSACSFNHFREKANEGR